MRKIYCINCRKYKEFKKPKVSYIFCKTLLLSSICNKCGNEVEKIFEEEESIEILKILELIEIYNYFKNLSQEFRLKNIDETRNYFFEEMK